MDMYVFRRNTTPFTTPFYSTCNVMYNVDCKMWFHSLFMSGIEPRNSIDIYIELKIVNGMYMIEFAWN